MFHSFWPATFPSGEGSDFAGVVTKLGPGAAGFAKGEEVFGFTDERASHAEYAIVERRNLMPKPKNVCHGRSRDRSRSPAVRPMRQCGRYR